MAEIKWIKITTDMFNDEKIKIIESMPDADSILVIWIKLLTLAGRCNDGGDVTLSPNMPFTAEMLSTIFHRPLNTIRLALEILVKYEMIIISQKKIEILNWEKHQNIDGMELIKEQARLRNVKYRERKRLEQNIPTAKNDASVTSRDGIDKNRIDKNIDIYKTIVGDLNSVCKTNFKTTTPKTQSLIKARIKEGFTIENFKHVHKKKQEEWTGGDMEKFLRPDTLYGTKFESYVNQKDIKEKSYYEQNVKEQ